MALPKLGIDIAKRTFIVALLGEEKCWRKTFENTATGFQALTAWLTRHHVHQVHAVMEATGTYGED